MSHALECAAVQRSSLSLQELDTLARRKNGLNFQIWIAGGLVALSSIPLILAFGYPILGGTAISLFLLGTLMACGGWPVFSAGLRQKNEIIARVAASGVPYKTLDDLARLHVPLP